MKHKRLILAVCAALGAGILWFALTQEWLILNLPFGRGTSTTQINSPVTTRKRVTLYLPKAGSLQREEREILWGDNAGVNGAYLVASWLSMLEDEQLLAKKSSLQGVVAAHNGQELVISFDRAPVNKNGSTAEKLFFIEGLLKSIRAAIKTVTTVRLLVNHKNMQDHNLDFSRSWPIGGFLDTQIPIDAPIIETNTGVFTIMIDPAGDAQRTGRTIGDNFERSITFNCARALKEELEKTVPQIRVIITREPGETAEPLQNATFSNRLHANLFMSLNCYQESQEPTTAALYYLLYEPITDFWYKKTARTSWDPYFTAHCTNLKLSVLAIKTLQDTLSQYRQKGLIQLAPYRGIPCKPLVGVQAPAICCEFGLSSPDSWRLLIGPLVDGISHVIESLRVRPVSFF